MMNMNFQGGPPPLLPPPPFNEGELCEALWEDGFYYKAIVEYETNTGWYITFPEYGTSHEVDVGRLRKIFIDHPVGRHERSDSQESNASSVTTSTTVSNGSNYSNYSNGSDSGMSLSNGGGTPNSGQYSSGRSGQFPPLLRQRSESNSTTTTNSSTDSQSQQLIIEEEERAYEALEPTPRNLVAMEIVDTEKSYVDSLEVLNELYIQPLTLRARADGASAPIGNDSIPILFSNLTLIYNLNLEFLQVLTARLVEWLSLPAEEQCLGDLFVEFAPYFKMYSSYCQMYEGAAKLLGQIEGDKKYEAFHAFCREAVGDKRSKGRNLSSFLIMPIQRVPRYALLLQEFQKKTDKSHRDSLAISKALESITTVATHINEAVRRKENSESILSIESQFITNPNFVHPSRVFIRQGPLIKKCSRDDKRYEFFLFNNLFAYARQVGWKYSLNRKLPIDNAFRLLDLPPNGADRSGLGLNRFMIEHPLKNFVILCKDSAEKQSWMRDLDSCIQQQRSTIGGGIINPMLTSAMNGTAPTSNNAEICGLCGEGFTLFRSKQTCRACTRTVCGDCSKSKLMLESDKKPQRVCDACARNAGAGNYTFASLGPNTPQNNLPSGEFSLSGGSPAMGPQSSFNGASPQSGFTQLMKQKPNSPRQPSLGEKIQIQPMQSMQPSSQPSSRPSSPPPPENRSIAPSVSMQGGIRTQAELMSVAALAANAVERGIPPPIPPPMLGQPQQAKPVADAKPLRWTENKNGSLPGPLNNFLSGMNGNGMGMNSQLPIQASSSASASSTTSESLPGSGMAMGNVVMMGMPPGMSAAPQQQSLAQLGFMHVRVHLWTVTDVYDWLSTKEIDFLEWRDSFKTNRIDGALLMKLTEEDLKNDLGITSGIQRKRFFSFLEKLLAANKLLPGPPMPSSSPVPSSTPSVGANGSVDAVPKLPPRPASAIAVVRSPSVGSAMESPTPPRALSPTPGMNPRDALKLQMEQRKATSAALLMERPGSPALQPELQRLGTTTTSQYASPRQSPTSSPTSSPRMISQPAPAMDPLSLQLAAQQQMMLQQQAMMQQEMVFQQQQLQMQMQQIQQQVASVSTMPRTQSQQRLAVNGDTHVGSPLVLSTLAGTASFDEPFTRERDHSNSSTGGSGDSPTHRSSVDNNALGKKSRSTAALTASPGAKPSTGDNLKRQLSEKQLKYQADAAFGAPNLKGGPTLVRPVARTVGTPDSLSPAGLPQQPPPQYEKAVQDGPLLPPRPAVKKDVNSRPEGQPNTFNGPEKEKEKEKDNTKEKEKEKDSAPPKSGPPVPPRRHLQAAGGVDKVADLPQRRHINTKSIVTRVRGGSEVRRQSVMPGTPTSAAGLRAKLQAAIKEVEKERDNTHKPAEKVTPIKESHSRNSSNASNSSNSSFSTTKTVSTTSSSSSSSIHTTVSSSTTTSVNRNTAVSPSPAAVSDTPKLPPKSDKVQQVITSRITASSPSPSSPNPISASTAAAEKPASKSGGFTAVRAEAAKSVSSTAAAAHAAHPAATATPVKTETKSAASHSTTPTPVKTETKSANSSPSPAAVKAATPSPSTVSPSPIATASLPSASAFTRPASHSASGPSTSAPASASASAPASTAVAGGSKCVKGHVNKADAKFCTTCGDPVTKDAPAVASSAFCTNCGKANTNQMRFCTSCGTELKKK